MERLACDPFVRFAGAVSWRGESADAAIAYDCRLFYVRAGTGTVAVGGEDIPLRPSDLLYIPPAVPYLLRGEPRLDLWAVNFDFSHAAAGRDAPLSPALRSLFRPEEVTEYPPAAFAKATVCRGARFAVPALENMLREKEFSFSYADEMASALLRQILLGIMRRQNDPLSSKEEQTVRDMIAYIDLHCTELAENGDLAAVFSYHSYYLNRIFKKSTGETIHSYLLRARVRYACSLLLTEPVPVAAVAQRAGFVNVAHFSKVFRRYCGLTPSEYRKERHLI